MVIPVPSFMPSSSSPSQYCLSNIAQPKFDQFLLGGNASFYVPSPDFIVLYTLLFMSRKRGGNWVTLFGSMHLDNSFGLEPGFDGDPPG